MVDEQSSDVWEATRESLARAARRLAEEGLVHGFSGNISVRTGDAVAITAAGATLELIAPEQVTLVDAEGRVLAGDLPPSSELALHLGVYSRYGAGAVVHTHGPMAAALACVIDEVPCVHYEMTRLGGSVRVAPYRTFGTPELAEVTLAALDGRKAALMANHGAIVYAEDLEGAVRQAQLLEWACGVYWHAAAIGTPRALDLPAQQAVVDAVAARTRRH